jgi:hypothetical protein
MEIQDVGKRGIGRRLDGIDRRPLEREEEDGVVGRVDMMNLKVVDDRIQEIFHLLDGIVGMMITGDDFRDLEVPLADDFLDLLDVIDQNLLKLPYSSKMILIGISWCVLLLILEHIYTMSKICLRINVFAQILFSPHLVRQYQI